MALTPSGFPFPVGSDRVVDGDNQIRALAEAIPLAINPFTIGGGGVSIVDGGINLTSATAVRCEGFLTPGFQHYRFTVHAYSAAGTGEIALTLADPTEDITSYHWTVSDSNGSVQTTARGANAANAVVGNLGGAGGVLVLDMVFRPGVSNTGVNWVARSFQASGTYLRHAGGYRNPKAAATWTGIILRFGQAVTGRMTMQVAK